MTISDRYDEPGPIEYGSPGAVIVQHCPTCQQETPVLTGTGECPRCSRGGRAW